jgi:hypothetical protein
LTGFQVDMLNGMARATSVILPRLMRWLSRVPFPIPLARNGPSDMEKETAARWSIGGFGVVPRSTERP